MVLNQNDLVKLYRRLASRYDLTTNLYRATGFPMGAFRKAAVRALALRTGDIVIELACGTGLNFPLLQQSVGPSGKIIGVDMTDAMLAKARERIERHGWRNVELVHCDVTQYEFKAHADGILSTFAMQFVAEYDGLIRRCSEALNPGKRLAIADLKLPNGGLARLAPLLSNLVRPYGTTIDLANRRPWESVVNHVDDSTVREFYFGCAYLASGQRKMRALSP